jgi:CRISPR/Cas system CMR-associated protein Cmr1 (group 7 of RAMP superfamily)
MAQWSKYDSQIGKALNKNPDINNQKLAEKLLGLKRKRSGDSVDLLRTYISRHRKKLKRKQSPAKVLIFDLQTKVTFGGFGSRTSKQVLSLKIGSFFLGVLSGCLRMRYIVLGLR